MLTQHENERSILTPADNWSGKPFNPVPVSPTTFWELGHAIYKERISQTEKPEELEWFFANADRDQTKRDPYLGLFTKPWMPRGVCITLFPISGWVPRKIHHINLDKAGHCDRVYPFNVYDLSPDELVDTSYLGRPERISPHQLAVVSNIDQARTLNSWVIDESMRSKISAWSIATQAGSESILKYVQLREAPFITENSPKTGKFTVEGVLEEARRPATQYPIFTTEHVKWLREYLKSIANFMEV